MCMISVQIFIEKCKQGALKLPCFCPIYELDFISLVFYSKYFSRISTTTRPNNYDNWSNYQINDAPAVISRISSHIKEKNPILRAVSKCSLSLSECDLKPLAS